MPGEFRRNVFVEREMDSYRGFLSDDWAAHIDEVTVPAPALNEFVFDLVMEWRAAAYTASLPATVLDHTKSYHDSFVNTGDVNTNLVRMAETLPALLARQIPELTSDPALIRRLQVALVEIGARQEEIRDQAKDRFPLEETWETYLQHHVYQLSLWGSQRICYVAIYNAYENFIVQIVKFVCRLNGCQTKSDEFKAGIRKEFDKKIPNKCWYSNQLNIARLARHAITHAGGRVTVDLAKQKHGFVVCDDRIQVTPTKTRELLATLKDAALTLAMAAVKHPRFQGSAELNSPSV